MAAIKAEIKFDIPARKASMVDAAGLTGSADRHGVLASDVPATSVTR